ncbi:hypothetical protein [Candidatus Williamhamiltonella defendens]|uniref:hypothetical protein n=1 Tax=Candidatus Williamhamiltonella defendens TaxID=138072 RepID=UPI00130E767E|nr:hypothetical protein [Candidatus Hamiltonella defensa]
MITYVGVKNKVSNTIEVLIDNQLITPKIILDPETHPTVLWYTVQLNNSDIYDDSYQSICQRDQTETAR